MTGIPIDQILAGFAAVHMTGPETVEFAQEVLANLRQFGLDPDENRAAAESAKAALAVAQERCAAYESDLLAARESEFRWKAEAEAQRARADVHEASTRLLEHMSQPHVAMVPPDLGNMLGQIKAAREVDPLPDESNG